MNSNLSARSDTQKIVLMLMQALIGAISANFRMITLQPVQDGWTIWFFLERHDPEDEEEIEDIVSELYALQWPATSALSARTVIGTQPLEAPDWKDQYTVFRRRE